jgi:hypothetical protein
MRVRAVSLAEPQSISDMGDMLSKVLIEFKSQGPGLEGESKHMSMVLGSVLPKTVRRILKLDHFSNVRTYERDQAYKAYLGCQNHQVQDFASMFHEKCHHQSKWRLASSCIV